MMFDIFHTVFRYKEKESPDDLGYFPLRVHTEAMPERRYLWTSRVLVIMASISICINMMLACTIYLMLPQRSVYPKLFTINKYFSELEQVQPAELYYPVTDLVAEQYITEYIYLRYIITNDYDEIRSRWAKGSRFFWYSSSAVYENFAKNDAEYSIMLFRDRGLRRDVQIDWIRPLATSVWQVQFQTMDYLPTQTEPTIHIWRATMRIAFVNIPFKNRDDAIINPFGFMVNNFSLAYLGTPETSAHYLEISKQASERLIM